MTTTPALTPAELAALRAACEAGKLAVMGEPSEIASPVFVATFDPDTCLRLLDTLESAQRRIATLTNESERVVELKDRLTLIMRARDVNALYRENRDLISIVHAMEQEIADASRARFGAEKARGE